MQGPDVSRILSRWPYPEAAVAAYSSAMTAAFNDPEARSAIESAMSDYAAGRRLDARALLAHLESLGPECGVHGYTMRMLPLIAALDAAEVKYRERGLSGEMFRDSFADLLWKTLECGRRHGVWGSTAALWTWGFFEFRIFGLGRLQFEPVEYAGAPALSVHSPSSGPLRHPDCAHSYARAADFFGQRRFVCDSWLLHPVCHGLPEGSGIRSFAADYELQFVTDDPKFLDVWNIFGCAWTGSAADLPADTTLRRLWRDYLLRGGVPGRGYGLYESF